MRLRTPARHLGHLSPSWQFDWPGIKPVDPMPITRQERESIARSVTSQVLAELAKNPVIGAKKDDPGSVSEIRRLLTYLNMPGFLQRPTI
jgi:hypothetical protein